MKTLVIIPTYNERATIGQLLEKLLALTQQDVEILIVDDGSPDGTAEVVTSLDRERVHLLSRDGKRGLASAYIEGFQWAFSRGFEAIVEMDGDLSHDPESVPMLVAGLEGADLVVGSRYVPGGSIENWSRFRRALSYAGNRYARAWLSYDVRDSTSGFRVFRSTVLAMIDLRTVHAEGYAFQIEMTQRVVGAGARVAELPITFRERRFGRSKLSRRIVFEALWRVPVWGLKQRVRARRRR